jgi:methylmalonyl-CoA carboxyltransferase 12S subunit
LPDENGSPLGVTALLRRIEELERRVNALEEHQDRAGFNPRQPSRAVPASELAVPTRAAGDEISDDTLAIITAAVAAFLGVRAHVRTVRLQASDAWAQQGRVSIMASHAMHRN